MRMSIAKISETFAEISWAIRDYRKLRRIVKDQSSSSQNRR